MPYDDNLVKAVVVSNSQIMLDSLANMLDPKIFSLEFIRPKPKLIAEIRKETPDIYIVDGTESEEDVLSTCLNIRSYSGMPILVLAADHKPELVEQVLDAGADEFLIKPVSESILVATLKTLTRRSRAETNAAISIVNCESGDCHQDRLLTF